MFLLFGVLAVSALGVFIAVGNRVSKSVAQSTAEALLLAAPADFVDGALVRVEGTVEASEVVVAPVDGSASVAFRLFVRVAGRWKVSTAMRSFVLRTEHGPIIVDHQAEIALAMRPQLKCVRRGVPVEYQPLVPYAGFRSVYCEQTSVAPGTRVWVAGVVSLEPAPPTSLFGFRDTNQLVRLRSAPRRPLTIGALR